MFKRNFYQQLNKNYQKTSNILLGWAPLIWRSTSIHLIFLKFTPWKINLESPQFVYNLRFPWLICPPLSAGGPNPGESLQGCPISTPLFFILVVEIHKKVKFSLNLEKLFMPWMNTNLDNFGLKIEAMITLAKWFLKKGPTWVISCRYEQIFTFWSM